MMDTRWNRIGSPDQPSDSGLGVGKFVNIFPRALKFINSPNQEYFFKKVR